MAYFANFIPYGGALAALLLWREHNVLAIAALVAAAMNIAALVADSRAGDIARIWIFVWWLSNLSIGALLATGVALRIF